MKINPIFYKMRISDYMIFGQLFLEIIQKINPEKCNLLTSIEKLENLLNLLKKLAGQSKGSIHSDDVVAADTVRDNAVKAAFNYVEACQFRNREGYTEAAELILSVIKKHGRTMYNYSLNDQSAATITLFEELNSHVEYQQAIDTIKSRSWFNDILKYEDEFLGILNKRTDDLAEKQEGSSFETQKEIRSTIEDTLKIIEVMYSMNNDDELKHSLRLISEETDRINRSVKSRKSDSKIDNVSSN